VPAVQSVLVVGAGSAGCAAAIALAEAGVSVDLIEAQPEVDALGSGITLQGNALRVLRQLGVWEEVRAAGYVFDTLGLRAPDETGTLLVEIDDIRVGGPDLPATMGIYRPTLARILVARAVAVGAEVRFGTRCASFAQDDDGVEVIFADSTVRRYDVVIGADGIRSQTRRAIGIHVEPQPIGMGIWRAFVPRPASVTRSELYYGGPALMAGYTPTGEDSLYAFVVEPFQDRAGLTHAERAAVMHALAQGYHGPWDEIRDHVAIADSVNYAAFESHLVPMPWNRGRVVIIGDAAHSCPPNLAQGAAMALEDAAVLAELLAAASSPRDVWPAFSLRREERVRVVVDGSVQIAQWLRDHEQGDVPALMARVAGLLSQRA
jgi:2-polyprenyl-6-methoxyphenol hydroxylase-like FAD-dependent oxidoreductase